MKLRVLKCPECHANLEVGEDRTVLYCQYCGCKILMDDEKQETTTNKNININKNITNTQRHVDDADVIRAKNEERNASRSFKESWIVMVICFAFLIGIPLGMFLNKTIAQNQGKIRAGYYRDLIGEDYRTVEAHFEAAGFTNIEMIDLDDSGIAFWTDGEVETISVGGDTSFESTDWFYPDTRVVISYH